MTTQVVSVVVIRVGEMNRRKSCNEGYRAKEFVFLGK